jgi:hypothetical protein
MLSAFLSPVDERLVDPEDTDEELDADKVHDRWKKYYAKQKHKMKREYNTVVRCLEKSREEIAKVRDQQKLAVRWWQMHSGKQVVTGITQPCEHTCDGLFICQLYLLPDLLEEMDCKEDTPLMLPFCIVCFPLTVDNSDMN